MGWQWTCYEDHCACAGACGRERFLGEWEAQEEQHAEQDHNSYREFEYLETGEPETGVQMPPPEERGVKTATRKSSLAKSLPQQVNIHILS